eukprot:1160726-Pelagomonas_calceolata.AAC.9
MHWRAHYRKAPDLEAYEAAKKAGKHTTIQPPVQDTAAEIMGLLSRQEAQEKQLSAKSRKAHNSNALITPPHIQSALRKWCMVSTERFSNPLEFDCTHNTYFSTSCRDLVFGAHTDAFSIRYCGYSFCHPPHDDEIMFQLLRHAVNSSLQTIKPVATFMLLPHWRGFSCNAYMSWLNHCPGLVQVLAKFPAGKIQLQAPQHWFNTIPNPAQFSYPMQLIVVRNLHAREALDNANKDWLQLLNRDIPEAHWLPLPPPNSAIHYQQSRTSILVALQQGHTAIASDIAPCLSQILKQTFNPMRMRTHLHAELFQAISTGADACARAAALTYTTDIALPDARDP